MHDVQSDEHGKAGLTAVLHAVTDTPIADKPMPVSFAPVVDRAPAILPDTVRKMHEAAAKSLEDAADAFEAEMQSKVQLMRDEAASIRSQGESQAQSIELMSTVIRDVHHSFRAQADKMAQFRAGIAA